MNAITLPLLLAALATSAAASAQATDQVTDRLVRGESFTRDQVSAMADRAFDRLDVDANGAIDEADRTAIRQTAFDRLDRDGDDTLSLAEFQTTREQRRERRAERGEARQGGIGLRCMARLGAQADTDGDGTISREEFRAGALARLAAVDADQDGQVTPAERRSAQRRSPAG